MDSALEGVRVLDLSRVWSGPLAGRILADLGAEVIQVVGRVTVPLRTVTREMAEMMGAFPDDDPGERPWNRYALGIDMGRNKLGIALELNTPEGVCIFKRLVKVSHVVLENFSPRVMPNFGLGYEQLRRLNPGIILCSMPGFGSSGPSRDFVSYGTNLDPASGLASLMGYPGEGAHMSGNAYPDPAAALHAACAILAAVFHQRRTGAGQHIDLSQAESATCLMGEAVLGYVLNGKLPRRMGNRHPLFAPHGCYRCLGEDKWVTIAISSQDQWEAFGRALGNPPWFNDERFADELGRSRYQDELDARIESWTAQHTHYEVMERLQRAGVPAGAVLDASELVSDPHLAARGFFWEIEHPEAGRRKYCGFPARLSRTPARPKRSAPLLGQDNRYVLEELMGLSGEEISKLEDSGAIGNEPIG